MFKVIDYDEEIPKGCFKVAKIYGRNETPVEKIICKDVIYGRNPKYVNKDKDNLEFITTNENQCQYCEKILSSKQSKQRHEKNNCKLKQVNEIIQEKANGGFKNEIIVPEGKYILNMSPNSILRDVITLYARSGSGKSTLCKYYMMEYKEMFPENDVILISKINKDKNFKPMVDTGEIIGVDLTDEETLEELKESPIDAKDILFKSLTIFDDHNSIDKKVSESLFTTLNDVITIGRDQSDQGEDIYTMITSHNLDQRNPINKAIIAETSMLVLFPKYGSKGIIKKYLEDICGLDSYQRKKIKKLNTTWISVSLGKWPYILHEGGCFKT